MASFEPGENLCPRSLRALAKELRSLTDSPPEGIRLTLNEDNVTNIQAEIDGPVGTPYDGGMFRMKLMLGQDYPQAPPKGFFLTKIFHPNVAKNGEICVNVLKKDWKPTLGLRHVLVVIRCLLIEPFPESALNEDAGKLLMEDYSAYAHHARLMTSIHAPKPKLEKSANSKASTALPGSEVHVPLTVNLTNTDVILGEAHISKPHSSSEILWGTDSLPGSRKGSAEITAKVTGERRKGDVKKKALKRL